MANLQQQPQLSASAQACVLIRETLEIVDKIEGGHRAAPHLDMALSILEREQGVKD